MPDPKPLLGYLGCPISGSRTNSKINPYSQLPSVDTLLIDSDAADQAIAHFLTLGYERWTASGRTALLILAKLDPASIKPEAIPSLARQFASMMVIVCHCSHPHPFRAAAAILSVELLQPQLAEQANSLIRQMIDQRGIEPAQQIAKILALHSLSQM